MPEMSNDHFVKPFINVHCASVNWCDLGKCLPQFVEWFPNLRHFKINGVDLTRGFDQTHLRHLEHLDIVGEFDEKYSIQRYENLLRTNKQ